MAKTSRIPSKENLEDMLKLFEPESGFSIHTEVPVLPKGDWRSDGYRWIHGATLSVTSKSGLLKTTAFTRTKDWELQKLKLEKDKRPIKIYSEKLLEAAEKNVDNHRQHIDVVPRLTDDQIYHLIEIAYETEFIHDITITPHQIVTCFRKETLSDFKELIDRDELPTMCLSYDITFEMGDFYVSVLT
ncbi:hypothetical protein GHT06_020264 [Daphnia sinensis]|uniref:Uncharacterized protein n=1 Tax=Daphnia sinensis TaxID=1820382 RepID=A0AAD5L468_9CRUS|nr:hypothetical protein GHT06_020264 [Daphnia sinensis]